MAVMIAMIAMLVTIVTVVTVVMFVRVEGLRVGVKGSVTAPRRVGEAR